MRQSAKVCELALKASYQDALRMAVWSERHVMQLDKRLLKLARTLWLIVSSRSAGPQKILNWKY